MSQKNYENLNATGELSKEKRRINNDDYAEVEGEEEEFEFDELDYEDFTKQKTGNKADFLDISIVETKYLNCSRFSLIIWILSIILTIIVFINWFNKDDNYYKFDKNDNLEDTLYNEEPEINQDHWYEYYDQREDIDEIDKDSEENEWVLSRVGKFDGFYKQDNICYFSHIIKRVNNRPSDPAVCFSACAGWNLLDETLTKDQFKRRKACVGFTLLSKRLEESDNRGSSVCLLLFEINSKSFIKDSACLAGKLLPKDQYNATKTKINSNIKYDYALPSFSNNNNVTVGKENEENNSTIILDQNEHKKDKIMYQLENFIETCPKRAVLMDTKLNSKPLKIFITCLQASGCSLLAYLLGQRDGTTSLLDIGIRQDIPHDKRFFKRAIEAFPKVDTIVIKHPLRGDTSYNPVNYYNMVKKRYNPEIFLLFVRDPIDMFLHLTKHISVDAFGSSSNIPSEKELSSCFSIGNPQNYGLTCGSPESKLRALDTLFLQRKELNIKLFTYESICIDRVLLAEDLNNLGMCVPYKHLISPKWTIIDVMRFSFKFFPSDGIFWGPGNLQNTFHTKWGQPYSEDEAYKICSEEINHEKTRPILLDSAIDYLIKYQGKDVSKDHSLAIRFIESYIESIAPNIFGWYKNQSSTRF